MARTRKPSSTIQPTESATHMDDKDHDDDEEADETKPGFFACYLLCSLSPRHKGHTYIGFTVNPRRRIRQHNGEMRCGAWRTKLGRPWEMILCIYGFPSNVTALQFEWAWQHPTESLAVRKAASNFKSLSGIANKIKLAYTMLSLQAWENLNLTVNFFSTKYMKHTGVCPRLPKQMRVNVCAMDELPCYIEGYILDENNYDEDEDFEEEGRTVNVNEPVPMLSDNLDNGVEGYHSSLVLGKESCSTEFPCKSLDKCKRIPSIMSWRRTKTSDRKISCNQLPKLDETIRESDGDRLSHQTAPSSEKEASLNGLGFYGGSDVIDLSTPYSCKVRPQSEQASSACAEIIDLTDSPIIFQR